MTFNLWPSSTVRSTRTGLWGRSAKDWFWKKEKESTSGLLPRLLICLTNPAGRSKAQLPWKPWICDRVWAPRRTLPLHSSERSPGTWSSRISLDTGSRHPCSATHYLTCVSESAAKLYQPLTNFVVYAALHLPHRGPALLLLHFRVIVQNLVPQPGQVVNTYLIFLS